jgi:hypothetical protein
MPNSGGACTIVLNGDNKIAIDAMNRAGIFYQNYNVTIQGSGTLDIKAAGFNVQGIFGTGSSAVLIINGSTVKVESVTNGLDIRGLTISNGSKVEIKANSNGISSGVGGITIDGSTLNIKAEIFGVRFPSGGDLTITNSSGTIQGNLTSVFARDTSAITTTGLTVLGNTGGGYTVAADIKEDYIAATLSNAVVKVFVENGTDNLLTDIWFGVPVTGITTASLPNGATNSEYNQQLDATGTAPITWSIVHGDLPNGLSLDTSTGVIYGTPTQDGTFNFTVRAANYAGHYDRALSVVVNFVSPPTGIGVPFSIILMFAFLAASVVSWGFFIQREIKRGYNG